MRKLSFSLAALVLPAMLILAAIGRPSAQTPESGQGRKIPGINAPDAYPRACVDCHVADGRLSVRMKEWVVKVSGKLLAAAQASAPSGMKLSGKHPKVDFALSNIPAGCLSCHGRTSKAAPPFAQLMHSIHLAPGANSMFVTKYSGECTHCHKPNVAKGLWTTPSGPEKP